MDSLSIGHVNSLNVTPDTTTVVSIDAESTYSTTATTNSGGSGSLIGWISIGLSICIAIIAWKISKKILSDIQKIHHRLNENEDAINNALQTIEELNNKLKTLKNNVSSAPKYSTHQIIEPVAEPKEQEIEYVDKMKQSENHKQLQTKYATLQSPDENDILRFSERSMIETPSPQKMFLIEIDTQLGIGTYRINPSAKSLIISDLQMFRDFVKPFTFSGDSVNATIQDKTPGKISKHGNFWVVEELLEIIIFSR